MSLEERKDTINSRRFDGVRMCDDMMGSRFWVGAWKWWAVFGLHFVLILLTFTSGEWAVKI